MDGGVTREAPGRGTPGQDGHGEEAQNPRGNSEAESPGLFGGHAGARWGQSS